MHSSTRRVPMERLRAPAFHQQAGRSWPRWRKRAPRKTHLPARHSLPRSSNVFLREIEIGQEICPRWWPRGLRMWHPNRNSASKATAMALDRPAADVARTMGAGGRRAASAGGSSKSLNRRHGARVRRCCCAGLKAASISPIFARERPSRLANSARPFAVRARCWTRWSWSDRVHNLACAVHEAFEQAAEVARVELCSLRRESGRAGAR